MRKPTITDWKNVPLVFGTDYTALVLGVSQRTVIDLVCKGQLKAVKVGKNIKITKNNLMKFIEGD